METNICWARDADSGPVGLCSYSWVCVRAVRDSWLIYLVLSLVHYCGVQSCVWLLTCQRGRKSEGKQGMACAPVGFVCCPTASPTASVCAWWALAVHRGNVGIKLEYVLYGTDLSLNSVFLFELLLAKFCWSKDLLFVSTRLGCV